MKINPTKPKTTVAFRLPQESRRILQALAFSNGVKLSPYIGAVLLDHIRRNEHKVIVKPAKVATA